MSKLITNTIRHTGGSADNITLDNSQNVTVEAKLTVANKDDDNVNVLEVKNDNGNVSGGFTQASDGDGQVFCKKNDGTNTVLFRSDGNSHITGGSLIIGDTNQDNAHVNANDLIIGDTGSDQRSGMTIVSDTDKDCSIHFSDGAGAGQYAGQINYDHNGDILRFYTGTLQRARIDSDGLKFSTDSAAANALDDYEEGTFTPKLGGNANNSTYNVSGTGAYTKIGNVVHMTVRFHGVDLDSNADGCAIIYDLPFTGSYGGANNSVAGVTSDHITYNIVFSDDQRYTWYVSHNTTYWQGRIVRSNNSWADWDIDDFNVQNVMYIDFSGTYRTT